MKFPRLITAIMVFHSVLSFGAPPREMSKSEWTASNEGDIQLRLEQLRLPFSLQTNNSRIISYIHDYAAVGVQETETMLGRSSLFLPVFEHYLSIYQLPQELKYLPIVESGLKTDTQSPAGARGLWQLMEVTARQYKLRVSGGIDERLDPYRSTEAAMRLLSDLYDQYQDWPLTIAAYNCGPGRVNKAIRLARSKDYWKVSKHLPAETQRYVPAFVAAAYIHKHHAEHGLTPRGGEEAEQGVRVFRISTTMSISQIANACDTDTDVIRNLNPAFPGNVIPASDKGFYLAVPTASTKLFQEWLGRQKPYNHALHADKKALHTTYVTAPGDLIDAVARRFQCTVEDIMRWNNLKTAEIVVHQELNIYLTREFLLGRV